MACMRLLAVIVPAIASANDAWSCPALPPAGVAQDSMQHAKRPQLLHPFSFVNGKKSEWSGETDIVSSPVYDNTDGKRMEIGKLPRMSEEDAVSAVNAAAGAWDRGQGEWPQMSLAARIAAIEAVCEELQSIRDEIVNVLMWEIAKNTEDSVKEFDRTMDFVAAAIREIKSDPTIRQGFDFADWREVSGTLVRVRRGPIGVMLALAPFNYPLNEMYAMLIPSLLMGNTAVLKIPAVGGLVHTLTADAFAKHLPPGVINFVSGSGRKTMGPIMATGMVDVLGFIGGSKAADALIKAHPQPHRLKVFAQLEGKNLGIVMPDADLDVAAAQCTLGATSYNGQRCTAIKLIMVHEAVADAFVERLAKRIAALKVGLPWEEGVAITPLPEEKKPKYLEELIADALEKGAVLRNADRGGGTLRGALMTPALVDLVTPQMRLFQEEQFGPVVPVARFSDLSQVIDALKASWNGQQAALFTSEAAAIASLVDALSSVVGRININAQCGRSPDVVPFSGRRSSAMGTMSVTEALRAFSIETVIAASAKDKVATKVAKGLSEHSAFLAPI